MIPAGSLLRGLERLDYNFLPHSLQNLLAFFHLKEKPISIKITNKEIDIGGMIYLITHRKIC